MKRTALAVIALLLSTSAFASEVTQRYLVGTRRPIAAGSLRAVKEIVNIDVASREVRAFEIIDGFAANLTAEEAAEVAASGAVRWIEPVVERHAFATKRNLRGQTLPVGVTALSAPAAWAGKPLGTVNVVVMDTGVDYNHAELKGIWQGGTNVITGSNDPWDDNGHGTHVAGTIAAIDNDFGVVGVAKNNVRLWSVKVLDGGGTGTNEGLLQGMQWVAAKKAELGGNWVVNLSLGAKTESVGEREGFQKVADAGVLIVAATGNASTPEMPAAVAFPAAYPSVVAVGAITDKNELAYFSNQGPEVDFVAPGVSVLSTIPVGSDRIAFVLAGSDAYLGAGLIGAALGSHTAEWVYCGLGKPEEFPASVRGRIALIKRGGDITFSEKTRSALAAGAIAVAIFNHDDSISPWTLYSDAASQSFQWPVAVRMTLADGEALLKKGSGTITVAHQNDDYGEKSGTSMSCPHIVGAAALLWTLAPSATSQQVVNALTVTASNLGPAGHDEKFGAGVVNLFEAAKLLAPNTFGGITTGRPVGKRGGRG